jgi:hypothetical protein
MSEREGQLLADWVTHGDTVTRVISQPGRNEILAQNAELATGIAQGDKIKDLSFGRYLGSVPMVDILNWQVNHPDLFSDDAQIARKALIKFWNSSEGRPYRVQRA